MFHMVPIVQQFGKQLITQIPSFFNTVTFIQYNSMAYVQQTISGIHYYVPVNLQYVDRMVSSAFSPIATTIFDVPGRRIPALPAPREVTMDYNSPPPGFKHPFAQVHVDCEDPSQENIYEGPPSPTDFRVWEAVANSDNGKNKFKFKVMSYNVLAQVLLESHNTKYNSSDEELQWDARAKKIYREILSVDPDVVCLQEVQGDHLSYFIKLERNGYRGLYKRKTGNKVDGCAIFYKSSVFLHLAYEAIEYHHDDLRLLMPDNIGILVMLAPRRSPTTPVVVATTHLVYSSANCDIRLAQMRVLLADIDRFAYAGGNRYYPLIITGDFNAMPGSFLIKLLNTTRVAIPIKDRLDQIGVTDNCQYSWVAGQRESWEKDIDTEIERHKLHVQEFTLVTHPFNLQSVYDIEMLRGTAYFGNFSMIDYIYYTTNNLRLLERLGLPTTFEESVRIPNDIFASDHISIAAVFEMNIISY